MNQQHTAFITDYLFDRILWVKSARELTGVQTQTFFDELEDYVLSVQLSNVFRSESAFTRYWEQQKSSLVFVLEEKRFYIVANLDKQRETMQNGLSMGRSWTTAPHAG